MIRDIHSKLLYPMCLKFLTVYNTYYTTTSSDWLYCIMVGNYYIFKIKICNRNVPDDSA